MARVHTQAFRSKLAAAKGAPETYNAPGAEAAKAELRLRVLEHVRPARVLDLYCGRVGEMYQRAWKHADDYVGCDGDWDPSDTRRRYVCDNRRLVRAIDLSPFNVFDLDAFGSPWGLMRVLLHRRTWEAGELGAVVLTDGSTGRTRWGGYPADMRALLGGSWRGTGVRGGEALSDYTLEVWLRRAGVERLAQWRARSNGSGRGTTVMRYDAVVFRGRGAATASGPASRP